MDVELDVIIQGTVQEDIPYEALKDFWQRSLIFTPAISTGENKGSFLSVSASFVNVIRTQGRVPKGTPAILVPALIMERIEKMTILENSIKMNV